jgi:hypothetical protein
LQHVAGAAHQQTAGEIFSVQMVGTPVLYQDADGFLFCFCKLSDFFADIIFLLKILKGMHHRGRIPLLLILCWILKNT